MSNKIVKLIVFINRLSKKMKGMVVDLDKIAELLQDPEILPVLSENDLGVLTPEDYD